MATLLQLALDTPETSSLFDVAGQVADLVDAVEVGPRLLRAEGSAVVAKLRETIPNRPVAVWAETVAEVEQLLEVGVEGVTLSASLPDLLLLEVIPRIRETGRRLLVDLSEVSDPAAERERWERLHPDLLKIPVGANFRDMVGAFAGLQIPLAFCGEWGVAQVPWLLLYRPLALIAGRVITGAGDPRRAAEAIRARMEVTPMMRRFY
jgi:3-keto-L-gulonate-6-phosphate decarboxylase